ncbi:hypothetical protein CAPTEDRAFT_98575 [Capitella teleta]|uniref:LicD/FKTN/FKRP nucleotidyltransferase domain-containing protein n=1 Tax=Capitella teleta TaxID=283909 RepID=R7T7H6_CAPTE|nr:hypothetical protein CAPTEDRAFT_98575 [Capitella teleta]|eukprot:ELT89604.1 hypothetical protein CAPTEDRAFT_98575 [Capitella teleta]
MLISKPPKWYHYPAACSHSEAEIDQRLSLAHKIHVLLQANNVNHMLCYGTLWGILRLNDILPWDTDIDFCIWDSDLENIEEAYLHKLFKFEGIRLEYDLRKGSYRATQGDAFADIVIFELSDDFTMLQRLGLSYKFSSGRDSFPSRLIAAPLPTTKLRGREFPIPHGGIEIQKYLYPETWQKEVKPPNCL